MGGAAAVRSSAAWRTCQSRSVSACWRAASTSSPSNGARAITARRRTVALSVVAVRIAGSPAGSPSEPRAATADSRIRASSAVVASSARAATEPGSGTSRSPSAQAATSTTVGSSSRRLGTSATGAAGPPPPSSATSSMARLRTAADGSARAAVRSGVVRSWARRRAARAVARTESSTSCRKLRAVAASPWWPATAADRRRWATSESGRCGEGGSVTGWPRGRVREGRRQRTAVWNAVTRPYAGRPCPPPGRSASRCCGGWWDPCWRRWWWR